MAIDLAWFNVFPASERQSGSTVPPGTKTVSASVGSPAYNAWVGNGSYQGWQVFTGPFGTQSEAEQDLTSAHNGPGNVQGIASGLSSGLGNQSPSAALNTGQSAQNAVNSALSWEQALAKFFGALTSANTWIRVVKVMIGGTLVLVGIAHITGAEGAVSAAARKIPLPV